MIKEIRASLWFDEAETTATAYVEINDAEDSVVFTFKGKNQQDGTIKASRVRSKHTRKAITGISAELTLPMTAEGPYTLEVTPDNDQTYTVVMRQCTTSFHEDGTRNYRRPICDGRYQNAADTFTTWFETVARKDQ